MSIKKKNKSYQGAGDYMEAKYGALTLGRVLRSERYCREMSLTSFAKILGLSVQQLSDIEKGRRFVSAEKAASFAKKLGDLPALFVQLALQDSMNRAGLKFRIRVEIAS